MISAPACLLEISWETAEMMKEEMEGRKSWIPLHAVPTLRPSLVKEASTVLIFLLLCLIYLCLFLHPCMFLHSVAQISQHI